MFIPIWLALFLFAVVVCIFGVAIEEHEKDEAEKIKLQERVQQPEERLQAYCGSDDPYSDLRDSLEDDLPSDTDPL
jgi:hypothetical protein